MQKSENNLINQPEESISRVYGKVQQMLKQYDVLQKENDRNKKSIETLNKKLAEYEKNINLMQQQNLVLKASVASMTENDKKEMEQKINHYIRSIDKCISLLSK